MYKKQFFRQDAVDILQTARFMCTLKNGNRYVPHSSIAKVVNMDRSNFFRIVSGVTDCKVSTFLAILSAYGVKVNLKYLNEDELVETGSALNNLRSE